MSIGRTGAKLAPLEEIWMLRLIKYLSGALLTFSFCLMAGAGCANNGKADYDSAKKSEEAHGGIVLDKSPLKKATDPTKPAGPSGRVGN
jgi:hypothetical protein